MTVYVEGDYGQRKAAVLVLRNAGLTSLCQHFVEAVTA